MSAGNDEHDGNLSAEAAAQLRLGVLGIYADRTDDLATIDRMADWVITGEVPGEAEAMMRR